MEKIFLNSIKNAVKEINCAIKDNVTIYLEKGEYHIYPEDVTHKTLKISNSMAEAKSKEFNISYQKNLGIVISGKKNVVIDGMGSKLISHCKIIPFYVFESENVTIRNFSFDYLNPTTAEIKAIEVAKDYYVFEVHPDVKYRIDDNKQITWYGETFEFYPAIHCCQRYVPDDKIIGQWEGPMMDNRAKYEEIDKNVIKIIHNQNIDNPYFLSVGEYLHLRDGVRDQCGTLFDESHNVHFENMNMHYMHGLGIVSQNCDSVYLDKVVCAPEKNSGRIVSCFADATHFSNCRGEIRITDCVFDGTNDDAVNIHGSYMKIIENCGNYIIARHPHPETFNLNIFKIGDTIEVSNPDYMLPEDAATVVSAELINLYDIKITFDRTVDKFKEGFVIENISTCPEIYISGCVSRRIPTRGFLTSSRGKILIENNSFYSFRRAVVLMANDAKAWWETGPVKDVVIRNNRIYNHSLKPIIQLQPENTAFCEDRFVHNNIVIENNVAQGEERVAWLYAKSTDNILIKNNTSNFEPLPNEINHCGKIITE